MTTRTPAPFICINKCSFNPADFLGPGWTIDEQDERGRMITSLDSTKICFEPVTHKGHTRMTGEQTLEGLKTSGQIRLGGNHLLALWIDYKHNKKRSALEWLRKNHGLIYMDFFGLVLRSPGGDRCVLYLYWRGGAWDWNYSWLDVRWRPNTRLPILVP